MSYILTVRFKFLDNGKMADPQQSKTSNFALADDNIQVTLSAVDARNLLASIIDYSDDGILSKDLDGNILSWNKGAERLYGYTAAEIVGRNVSTIAPPDLPDEIPSIMRRIKNGEVIEHYETIRVRKDGTRINISLTVSPIKDSNGRIIAFSAIARDITIRKRAEEETKRLFDELTETLNQKQILLQEVYHRVKNNLQVISSLLDLRARYILDDPTKAAAAFAESTQRIRAMATVHEKLYTTGAFDKIEFGSYLQMLAPQLIRSYAIEKLIDVRITGDRVYYGLDTSIPLSLIFNELITNSLKYAFPDSNTGVIEITLKSEQDAVRIRYSDSGIGLPKEMDIHNSGGFGFRIIRLLTRQIKGTIRICRDEKPVFELTIPSVEHAGGDDERI